MLGLVVGALVIRGPVCIGPTLELDINTFLAAAMCILLGLQSVSFALIGRRFASRYGFIPKSETFDRILEALTLERVLAAAIVLILIGLGALGWAVISWATTGFGELERTVVPRFMIVAMTMLVAGLQMAMSGFMSSMIHIPLNEGRIAVAAPDDRRRQSGT